MGLPERKNIRLDNYNYSQNGAYFLTVCVKDRYELLASIVGTNCVRPQLSEHGMTENGRTQFVPTVSRTIKQFKGAITKKVGFSFRQPRFHDHIIRSEEDYQNHWQYVDENPIRWVEDEYYGGMNNANKGVKNFYKRNFFIPFRYKLICFQSVVTHHNILKK